MMIIWDPRPGTHIADACKEAVKLADDKKQDVQFTFNDLKCIAHPGDGASDLVRKWTSDCEARRAAWLASPERAAQEKERAEKLARDIARALIESATTEKELREASVPWPLTIKQVAEYIESLVDRSHDYGTCCYAMSMAAMAAFNYVSGKLGVTGFQASCADLDFLRRSRGMEGPFIILKAEDALYPQYDLYEKLREAMVEWEPWLKEQAEKQLKDCSEAAPAVIKHWKMLAIQGSRITDH